MSARERPNQAFEGGFSPAHECPFTAFSPELTPRYQQNSRGLDNREKSLTTICLFCKDYSDSGELALVFKKNWSVLRLCWSASLKLFDYVAFSAIDIVTELQLHSW